MPVPTQELLLVGSCNSWSFEAAKKSHCFSPQAVSDTVWVHECRLQLDKTGEVEFQVISKTDGWGWRLYPEVKDRNRLVCGDKHSVKASLSLFEEDADGQNFYLSEAAGSHVLIKILLSTHELLVWYEKAQAEPLHQTVNLRLQELPQHLQVAPAARWITVVWPYVPMRDQPDVSGKLVSVVKHGTQVEFEDLASGQAVTLQDILENKYLKVWSLDKDGSRQKTGWVCCTSDHGVHFAPFSDSADAQNALKPLLDSDNVQAQQTKFEVNFIGQRNFKLNMLPRATPPSADFPLKPTDMILLGKHRLYAPVTGPFGHATICGLPGGCASNVADWLRGKFELEVTVKSLAWLSNASHQEKVQQAGGTGCLLLLLLEEPLAWSLSASKGIGIIASQGCWATRLQWNEGGGPHELEYVPESEVAHTLGTARLLHSPLLYEGWVHPDGVASVWSCSIHAAVAAIATAAVGNAAILRVEDLLFRTSDLDAAFGDLVAQRRLTEDGGGPAGANEAEGQLSHLIQSFARLSLLQPKDVAHLDTITASIRKAVGYRDEEELRRWSSLARDQVGWLQEGEYCSFDPESKEDARQALEFLAENGYVVFRGVADKQEIETAEVLLWEFLAQCGTGIKRGVPSSWALPALSRKAGEAAKSQHMAVWPAEDGTGIISGNAIGQSAFMWHLRGLPRLRKAFGHIFGTDDLLASFDGAGVFRPYGHDPGWRSRSTWYHVDQGDGMHGFHSVQGLVSLTPATAETGGLVVVPGSHLCHEEFLERPESRGAGRLQFEDGDPALREWSKDAAGAILVQLQPGDAVLWDSRTVHCSTHALCEAPPEVLNGNRLLRAVGYVSMSPTAWATQETLAKRMDVFRDSRRPLRCLTSTHNAHDLHIVREEPMGDTAAIDLSDERLELAIGRDGGLLSTCAIEPGRPSFLPSSKYRCLPNGAPVRTAPSTQRGDCIRGINGGMSFTAHRFGEWLRLDDSEWVQACHAEPDTAKPTCAPPPDEEDEEDLFEAAIAAVFG